MDSVLRPWVMAMPWKMQSILLSGLRAPDAPTDATKRLCRWMRGESQHNAHPAKGYMQPQLLSKELINKCMDELEYLSCHYVHHFADAMAVIAYYHPGPSIAAFALAVHAEVAMEIFHFKPETMEEFIYRHRDRVNHQTGEELP